MAGQLAAYSLCPAGRILLWLSKHGARTLCSPSSSHRYLFTCFPTAKWISISISFTRSKRQSNKRNLHLKKPQTLPPCARRWLELLTQQMFHTVAIPALYLCLSLVVCKVCIFHTRTLLLIVSPVAVALHHSLKKLRLRQDLNSALKSLKIKGSNDGEITRAQRGWEKIDWRQEHNHWEMESKSYT